MHSPSLRPTRWLAQRLGLSVTTVERLRTARSPDLPPAITIGTSIRYDEAAVEQWLAARLERAGTPGMPQDKGGCDVAS